MAKHNSFRNRRKDERRVIQLQWVGRTNSNGGIGIMGGTLRSEEVSEKISYFYLLLQ